MRAWIVDSPRPIADHPLRAVTREPPSPAPGEVRVAVAACGVCRTDLHLAEGDLAPRRHGVVPGHEIVGVVDALGADASRFALGDRSRDRVAARHLRPLSVVPRRAGEPLSRASPFTGWDADGGYAEYAVVDEAFAYRAARRRATTSHAAPLLCAGIIGYRALSPRRAATGRPARHLRVRRVGAPRRPGRDRPRGDGARPHPLGGGASTRARPRCGLGRTRRRRTARAARRRRALRACRRARPRRDAGARPGRNPRRGGHLPQRHPLALLRRRAVPREAAPQRHRQHQGRR